MVGPGVPAAARWRNCLRWGSFILNLPLASHHSIGAREERRWHSNAKCIGGFHIDDQLEMSWLLDGQIGGLGAFEDFVDIHGSLAKKVRIRSLVSGGHVRVTELRARGASTGKMKAPGFSRGFQ